MIARWIGAAPRQRGSSEAWMLRQPRAGAVEHRLRQDQPVGHHHRHLGAERRERRLRRRRRASCAGVRTGSPSASARACTGLGRGCCPRPPGRGGWV